MSSNIMHIITPAKSCWVYQEALPMREMSGNKCCLFLDLALIAIAFNTVPLIAI